MTLEEKNSDGNGEATQSDAKAVAQNGDSSVHADNAQIFKPPANLKDLAHVKSMEEYKSMHKISVEDADKFWKQIAETFYFHEKQPQETPFFEYNFDYTKGPIRTTWLRGARTNLSYNCLDRNVLEKNLGKSIAYFWEGNDPQDSWEITYEDLLKEVCKFANALRSLGLKKGDRVAIYMPMIIELAVALLACARIGAVHSVVFGGYSADSLAERILDAKSIVLVTADGAWRGDKIIHLKEIGDKALEKCTKENHEVKHCIVVSHLSRLHQAKRESNDSPVKRTQYDYKAPFTTPRDKYYHELIEKEPETCAPEWVDAEDPLFILYTSGSTGKPKGVLHTTAGYMLYAATTFKYVFDYHPGDVYWCTADIGWITGHTYVCYGPLLNGAKSVIFEGTPFYPSVSRLWEIIEKYKVTQFYTAPTAIRSLMKFGEGPVVKHNLSSLKILGSVGEPINPEAWLWYHRLVGNEKCAIVDTFWQTETGGHVITPLPGATSTKPGSATFPFFGVVPELMDEEGKLIEGAGEGYLVFKQPWPGIMRTVYGDHERFETTYFKKFPGFYCTGDGAKRDEDGYIWITGRVDDMLNVSGHLLSTAQVESALIEHKSVSESAAVAVNHDVKGEALYCFVTLTEGHEFDKKLVAELKQKVREKIGAFATPETIQQAPALPKTRSGKIMRRILRKIAAGDNEFGDISTLADETVIKLLIEHKPHGL